MRARNFSNYTLAGSFAAFAGPLIAGFSIDHTGYDHACLIVVALAMAPISMLVLRGGGLPRGSGEARPVGNLWHALSAPGIWPVLAASSMAQTAGNLFQFYMPVYAHAAELSPSGTNKMCMSRDSSRSNAHGNDARVDSRPITR